MTNYNWPNLQGEICFSQAIQKTTFKKEIPDPAWDSYQTSQRQTKSEKSKAKQSWRSLSKKQDESQGAASGEHDKHPAVCRRPARTGCTVLYTAALSKLTHKRVGIQTSHCAGYHIYNIIRKVRAANPAHQLYTETYFDCDHTIISVFVKVRTDISKTYHVIQRHGYHIIIYIQNGMVAKVMAPINLALPFLNTWPLRTDRWAADKHGGGKNSTHTPVNMSNPRSFNQTHLFRL